MTEAPSDVPPRPAQSQDVTDRLQQSESRLRRAQAVARLGSWELDLATRSVWGSEEAFRIYGLPVTPDGLLPLDEIQRCPLLEYRAELDAALADLLARGRPYDLRFRIRRHDGGAIRRIHSMAQVTRDAAGRPAQVVGTIQDVTEQEERAEAMLDALRASEERARLAFDRAADAIIVIDALGAIFQSNEQASALTGLPAHELARRNVSVLFDPEDLRAKPFRFGEVLAGRTVVMERRLRTADGRAVPVEMSSRLLADGLVQTILRDISERRHLEEQLQLRQRMDSVGTLASGIAHDFNNILVGIMGFADLLRADAPQLAPEHRSAVESIVQAGRRAADLVQRLGMLTQPSQSARAPLDVARVAEEAWAVLRETTDRLVAKEVAVAPATFRALGNESDLFHVLLNLGVNAVQAVEQRGQGPLGWVRIEAAGVAPGSGGPSLPGPGPWLRITVSDSGIGMSPEVRRKAFEPLFSTKERGTRKGQGLGLAMVYNIVVRQHGGAVEIESEPGQGTKVHLYLPRAADDDGPRPAVSPAREARSTPALRGTVLVVDDEPSIVRLATRSLTTLGLQVLTAADGAEAAELFEHHRDTIDLVVLDWNLPRMTGGQVLEVIHRVRPDARVIVSSGGLITAPERRGVLAILPKPYTATALREAVARALCGDAAAPEPD